MSQTTNISGTNKLHDMRHLPVHFEMADMLLMKFGPT